MIHFFPFCPCLYIWKINRDRSESEMYILKILLQIQLLKNYTFNVARYTVPIQIDF